MAMVYVQTGLYTSFWRAWIRPFQSGHEHNRTLLIYRQCCLPYLKIIYVVNTQTFSCKSSIEESNGQIKKNRFLSEFGASKTKNQKKKIISVTLFPFIYMFVYKISAFNYSSFTLSLQSFLLFFLPFFSSFKHLVFRSSPYIYVSYQW